MNARLMRGTLEIATGLPKNRKYKRFKALYPLKGHGYKSKSVEDLELGGDLQAREIPVSISKN